MSSRTNERQHRQHGASQLGRGDLACFATAAPAKKQRTTAAKAGVLAAGTALAGTALVSAVPVAPVHPSGVVAPAHHDVALSAASFEDSVQALLDAFGVGTIGNLLDVFGPDLGTTSNLDALLDALNPSDVSLDALTGGILGDNVGTLLTDLGIGNESIDQLATDLLGASASSVSIDTLLGDLGLGQLSDYTGLLGLVGLNGGSSVAAALDSILSPLGIDPGQPLGAIDMDGDSTTLANEQLYTLLGLEQSDITEGWDDFVSELPTGGGLVTDPTGTLGDMTLGNLLDSLLPDTATLTDVADTTTVTDFLSAFDFFDMLGL